MSALAIALKFVAGLPPEARRPTRDRSERSEESPTLGATGDPLPSHLSLLSPADHGANGGEAGAERPTGERAADAPSRRRRRATEATEAKEAPAADGADPLHSLPSLRSHTGPGTSPPPDADFALVADPEELPAVVEAIRSAESVGLDIETTALNPRDGRLRLLQLALPAGTLVIDTDRVSDLSAVFEALSGVEVVGHNLKFDLSFLLPLGFTPGRAFDTMLASQVLDAGDRALKHNLADVCERHLGEAVDKAGQKSNWSGPLTEDQLRYAARDAERPVRLRPVLDAKLAEAELTSTAELENRALLAVAWMGVTGVAIDRPAWEGLAADAEAEVARLEAEMDALAPAPANLFGTDPRNWKSTDAVRTAFRKLGLALEATDDDALADLAHPLAELLRRHRSAGKRAGTYGAAWLAHVAADGRVYPNWKQNFTATGRMSCADPNLQQLPRDGGYRRCFVAPSGRTLVKADYSQIELRIAAVIAGEPAMIAAYARGDDLHALTAAAVLGKAAAAVTKADRQLAKAVNFGLLYGGGAPMLAGYAKSNYGVTLTAAQAAAYRAAFFRAYPKLAAWHRRQADGVTATRTLAGRRRKSVAKFTEKLNTPVQGTGADGLKAALALLWERRHDHPTAVPVLAVHDEIVVECAAADAEAVKAWLVTAMTDGMAPLCHPVPVVVETNIRVAAR